VSTSTLSGATGASSPAGPTGSSSPTGPTGSWRPLIKSDGMTGAVSAGPVGPTGSSSPLTAPIQQSNLLNTIGTGSSFLQGATGPSQNATTGTGSGGQNQPGQLQQQLGGGQLMTDLTNIWNLPGVGAGSQQGVGAGNETQNAAGIGSAFGTTDDPNKYLVNRDHADGGAEHG
jgi:hypothetical protein